MTSHPLSLLLSVICHPDAEGFEIAWALEAAKDSWRPGAFTELCRVVGRALTDSDENGMIWMEICA
jgi:hypothetical protein